MVVFETFALMKLLKKEVGYEKVAAMLGGGGFISEATLYELTYVTTRDFLDQGNDLAESLHKAQVVIDSLCLHLKKHGITEDIIQESIIFKITYSKYNLSHFDCLALATAKVLREPLFSGEQGLKHVKEVEILP